MADAQDLKFSKSHFLTTSRDFFSHAFQPLIYKPIFDFSLISPHRFKKGGFPTPKVAQKVATKIFQNPNKLKKSAQDLVPKNSVYFLHFCVCATFDFRHNK